METPTYIALSRQTGMVRDMNVLANNIANASTNGYRGESMMFQEYLARTGTLGLRDKISFVQDVGTFRNIKDGPLVQTNNELDLALQGQGYMVIGNPAGDQYARTGMFHLDANRQVVTAEGYPLLQENGRPINIPLGAQKIVVSGDGVMSTEQGEIGRIRLVRFGSDQAMRAGNDGLYTTDQAPLPATETRVTQGALEGSNVQPVLEMTRMIQMSRDYASVQSMLDGENTRQHDAFARIAKA
ncbi:MAG: flagellar hook-basal body complex protein [Alphaproteobacteria bacterium]|nr:flagellar hook-basal body complex protein [Alphaproteobacteria bacterium]